MEQKTPLAIVVPIPKGEWSNTASYNLLNIVVHDGRSYICKSAGAGTEPVPAGNAQWQLIADKGESLTFDMLTQEQKDSLAASATAAANEARDYADAIRALLDSFASSSDEAPSAALAAQVALNKQGVAENKEWLNDLAQKVDEVGQEIAIQHPQTQEAGFFVSDAQGNIGMKYTEDGLDFAKISQHAVEILKDNDLGDCAYLAQTAEDGFFLVDEKLNIGIKYNNAGFDATIISEHFNSLIGVNSEEIAMFSGRFCIAADTYSVEAEKRANKAREEGRMLFEENFDDSYSVNRWKPEIGYIRNREPQYYTKDNYTIENSCLHIFLKHEKKYEGYEWTSSCLCTQDLFHFGSGVMVEARIKMDKHQGCWPAFWSKVADATVGDGAWPKLGEVDIFEQFGNGKLTNTFHWQENGVHKSTEFVMSTIDPTKWHIYGAKYDDNYVEFYVDGVMTRRVSYTTDGMKMMSKARHKLLLNVASGEGAGGNIDDTNGKGMWIDWVRCYSTDKMPKYPSSILVENEQYEVHIGETIYIHTTIDNCRNKTLFYEVVDDSIAKSNSEDWNFKNGITGVSVGTTKLNIFTPNGLNKTITIKVIN